MNPYRAKNGRYAGKQNKKDSPSDIILQYLALGKITIKIEFTHPMFESPLVIRLNDEIVKESFKMLMQ